MLPAAYFKVENRVVAGTSLSPFVTSRPGERRVGTQGFGTAIRAVSLQEPGVCSPPHGKCSGSAEWDVEQGSLGFSSFDGHGTHFDMVVGGLFFNFLPFFPPFSFNFILAMGFLPFLLFFLPNTPPPPQR